MKFVNRLAASLVALAAASLCAGASLAQSVNQQVSAGSVVEQIKKSGVLRVGVSTFVPWAMRDKKGDLVGFEIDVIKKIASDMGVKAELVPTQWSGIIPALLAGKFDAIISGLSVTTQRNLTINFTIPYAHSGQQIAANKKLAGKFTSLSQFNDPKVTLTCRRASSTCDAAKRIFPKATFRQFDGEAETLQEVLNGNAYAVIASAPTPRFWAIEHPDVLFMPTEKDLTTSSEGIGLRKGDPDAVNFFDNWIRVNEDNGWLQERHHYWFGTRDWASEVPAN